MRTQRSREEGSSGLQALRFTLATHDKLFNAHRSQRSVTLVNGTEAAWFGDRIAADREGQRGTGYRENATYQREASAG